MAETRRQIVIYSALLVPLGLAPVLTGLGGIVYGITAAVSGAVFMWLAIEVWRNREGAAADKAAKRLFGFSILYLFLLFTVLLVEGIVARAIA